MSKNLYDYRKKIDKIDNLIIKLLGERIKIVKEIGIFKKNNNLPFLDIKRWQKIIEKRKILAKKLKLNPNFIEEIWNLIHKEALKIEKSI